MSGRFWCSRCREVLSAQCQEHQSRRIGCDTRVEVVVLKRHYDLDVGDHGFFNNVGAELGRTPRQHEKATRRAINDMRRENKGRPHDGTARVVGAIPMAKLLALKKQHGDNILQNPRALLEPQGLWWG